MTVPDESITEQTAVFVKPKSTPTTFSSWVVVEVDLSLISFLVKGIFKKNLFHVRTRLGLSSW